MKTKHLLRVLCIAIWNLQFATSYSFAQCFSAAVNFAVGGLPASVASADFNGDGKLDLATAWNLFYAFDKRERNNNQADYHCKIKTLDIRP